MRLVVQKVSQASVTSTVESVTTTAAINSGLMTLVNFQDGDTLAELEAASKALLKLRIFPYENKRYHLNTHDSENDILMVSQFTLNATLKSGRPSFHRAMNPEQAKEFFHKFIDMVREGGVKVEHGVFGSWMQVHLVNEGPFTLCLEAKDGKCNTW